MQITKKPRSPEKLSPENIAMKSCIKLLLLVHVWHKVGMSLIDMINKKVGSHCGYGKLEEKSFPRVS